MRKYGFIKHSLVDYPGEVCSVVFLPGCNFCCPYCHNKTLSQEINERGWTLREITDYLTSAKSILTAVCITGGEPTLYPETLVFLVEQFKRLGLKVKVDTNGSHSQIIKTLDNHVDYFAMDLKTSLTRYRELIISSNPGIVLENIKDSIKLLQMRPVENYEFRTTMSWDFIGTEEMHQLGSYMKPTTHWFLQHCRSDQKNSLFVSTEDRRKINQCYNIAKKYTCNVFLRE